MDWPPAGMDYNTKNFEKCSVVWSKKWNQKDRNTRSIGLLSATVSRASNMILCRTCGDVGWPIMCEAVLTCTRLLQAASCIIG